MEKNYPCLLQAISHNVFYSCIYFCTSKYGIVTSNFSFSHNFFHSCIPLVCQNATLCGNGLRIKNSKGRDFDVLTFKKKKDKILAWSKLKAFADDKILVAKMKISVINVVQNIIRKGVKNILGKGENTVYQHFLLFP